MDLFDTIPDNFFSLLTGKNKRLYVQCLIKAFDVYEMGSILGIDKKIVADELTILIEQNHSKYEFEDNDELEDEDAQEALKSNRSLAYLVLRKFEEHGWIYTDVTDEYVEILNFTDQGITMCEALIQISPKTYYFSEDSEGVQYNPEEYNGYIFTIYSLLTANYPNPDYGVIMSQVFRNTKLLIRALRKLDSRLKDYIQSVVEQTEIKDLMIKLMDYKVELVDNGYAKLKTGDNINKYRLPIVSKLEEFEANDKIMFEISKEYSLRYKNMDEAFNRAYRDIDEMIDVFNSLDSYISEIDSKNKKYIDSTIGKIKFLLAENDNTIGKLQNALKYVKIMNKKNKIDSAINELQALFKLRQTKIYKGEQSLYTPRGKYQRLESQLLDTDRLDLGEDAQMLLQTFGAKYNPSEVNQYILAHLHDGKLYASDIVNYDSSEDDILLMIFCLMFASEHNYDVTKLDRILDHKKYLMNDFVIKEGE
jgi:hypothetical protein